MFRPAITLLVVLSLVTGVAYPLAVTVLAQLVWPHQANGSLIGPDGAASVGSEPIGSALIGQEFSAGDLTVAARFFWGRPSATAPSSYTAFSAAALTGSSGSNLAPSNPALLEAVRARVARLHDAERLVGVPSDTAVPVDLVTASASGLDPHVSIAAAEYQVPRVARARGVSESLLRDLVHRHASRPATGLPGASVVNILQLNCELERERK